jgi:hypothetical protein
MLQTIYYADLTPIKKLSSGLFLQRMRISDLLNPINDDEAAPKEQIYPQPPPTEPRNFCLICRRSFGRYSEYSRHMRTVHPTSETQWHTCPNPGCKMRFTRPDALRDHLKTKKARLYNCQSPSSSKIMRKDRTDQPLSTTSNTLNPQNK